MEVDQPVKRKRGRPRKNPDELRAEKQPACLTPIILSREATVSMVGMSQSTIVKLVTRGEFPRPRKISANRIGWLYSEIQAWAENLPFSDILPPRRCATPGD